MGKKKVLVVGSGGREHALAWRLAASPRVARVFCAPGNAGIAQHATCVPITASRDLHGLVELVRKEGIGLTVVGPEAPLASGLVDRFEAEGLAVFGPRKAAAEIEASKAFAKRLLSLAGIPTAPYRVFTEAEAALGYVRSIGAPLVLKADGLAAGKGVIVAKTLEEAEKAVDLILRQRAFGAAGDRLVVEDLLSGEEASFMVLTDGRTVLPLATSQDHKPAFDGDRGPNTGGMGAYSPAPVVTQALFDEVMEGVMVPTVRQLAREGRPYRGVLYGGLMIRDGRPQVLEFNCRFGDPEAQPILMRLRSDLMEVLDAAMAGELDKVTLEWDPRAAVCVVLSSGGYPGTYETGKVIHGLDAVAAMEDVMVFHAGTARRGDDIVTAGGRVLGVTALGPTVSEAIDRAYQAVREISWEGMHYRRDIGRKALRHDRPAAEGAGAEGHKEKEAPRVGIVLGSASDLEAMRAARDVLVEFGVPCEMTVASAHRSPGRAARYASEAAARGLKVLIAGAGMAAHLAGALAANTTLPVIGVPLEGSALNGLDALLATVQMPPGVPVATVAIGKAGARNAALLSVEILALQDEALAERLRVHRASLARQVEEQASIVMDS